MKIPIKWRLIVSNAGRITLRLDEVAQRNVGWLPGLFGSASGLKSSVSDTCEPQITSPWTNGKIEAFWDILQAEVLDPERFTNLAATWQARAGFAEYNRVTPAERYDGTPFTDQGFQNIPALAHLEPWLEEVMRAA